MTEVKITFTRKLDDSDALSEKVLSELRKFTYEMEVTGWSWEITMKSGE